MNNVPKHIKKQLGMYQNSDDDNWDKISKTADTIDEVLNKSELDGLDINYVLAMAQMDSLSIDFDVDFDEITHSEFMDEYLNLLQKYIDKDK